MPPSNPTLPVVPPADPQPPATPPPASPTEPAPPTGEPAPVIPASGADPHLTVTPGAAPGVFQQPASWVSTGAAGCEGLVPAAVAPRLTWTSTATLSSSRGACTDEAPIADSTGAVLVPNAAGTTGATTDVTLLPSSGAASFELKGDGAVRAWAALPAGFEIGIQTPDTPGILSYRQLGDDGTLEGEGAPVPPYGWYVNPRGGFLQTQTVSNGQLGTNGIPLADFQVRWLDASFNPATAWVTVLTWNYENIFFSIYVDAQGRALILKSGSFPLTMPCNGKDTAGHWFSPDGKLTPFDPLSPSALTDYCGDNQQFVEFGRPFARLEGGFAFYVRRVFPQQTFSGWYVYESGAVTPSAAPAWLAPYDGAVQPLATGGYLALRHDPADCSRTAEIVGPAGQICASVPLEGSAGCERVDTIGGTGTLLSHARFSCDTVWWPGLGR